MSVGNSNTVAFYRNFLITENDEVITGVESDLINHRLTLLAERIASMLFSHSTPFIKFKVCEVPKYYDLSGREVNKYIDLQGDLTSLHFFKNQKNGSIIPVINFDRSIITNTALVDRAANLFSSMSVDVSISNDNLYFCCVKIYMLLFGQMVNDELINNKRYSQVHYILDHSEVLINEIIKDLQEVESRKTEYIRGFLKDWQGYIERYRAIVFIEQGEFEGAIKHIFNSIALNPFFPYPDYQTLKQDYTKKYVVDMIPIMNEMNKLMELDPNFDANLKIAEELNKHISFFDVTYNYSIVREILQRKNSNEIVEFVTAEMEKLDNSEPFILLTKCEIMKVIPKGTERIDALFVEQFEDCIKLLKEMTILDPDFPLINTKLGTLMMMKGIHFDNQSEIEGGVEEYKKGMHIYSKLGLNIKK